MFIRHRTRGIILDKRERGEADQIFTIFTEDFGIIEVMGKAIRKIASKLRSGVDVFYLSEIEFIEGRTYKTLTDAIVQKKFFSPPVFLQNGSLAWRIAECTKRLAAPDEDRMLFLFLKRTFEGLHAPLPKEKQKFFFIFFLWNLMALLGYRPEFSFCVRCGRKVEGRKRRFAMREGGVVCKTCFSDIPKHDTMIMETTSLKLIRIFLSRPWEHVERFRVESAIARELREASFRYFRFLTEARNPA